MLKKRAARKLARGPGKKRQTTTKGMVPIRKKERRLGTFQMIA
jgi:hypothetical protein